MSNLSRGSYVCSSCLSSLAKVSSGARYGSRQHFSSSSISTRPFRLAIVGSGPAGFYAASRVMREYNQTVVDMYERLPVPYGLVRFGVAPDHPEVKNCQDRFEEIASLPNFNFIGNVKLGEDLSVESLKPHYDAILFAYGASKDRLLSVPGEDLTGVLSAREFVAWYNGLPGFENLNPPLTGNGTEAVVIGQGNVALDVARMLLADLHQLRHTDTPEPVLEALSRNEFRNVHIVGRRGPCQAAFTIKEIRELTGSNKRLNPVPCSFFPADPRLLPRPRKRIADLLQSPKNNPASAPNNTNLQFFLSPTSFESNGSSFAVHTSTFAQTRFTGHPAPEDPARYAPDARVETDPSAEAITLQSGIVFRSIGYKAEALLGLEESGIPFDDKQGIIPNIQGRVLRPGVSAASSQQSEHVGKRFIPGMYVTGWVKRGPTGVIATTMSDAFETADAIVADIRARHELVGGNDEGVGGTSRSGWDEVKKQLAGGVRPVSWEDWRLIDVVEKERGAALGKPREKITSVKDMLSVLDR